MSQVLAVRGIRLAQSLAAVLIMLLPTLACGPINPQDQFNNDVRQAIVEYDQAKRGPVDDLLIHFKRDEPRTYFEQQQQHGGQTIWLPSANAQEYFATRLAERTYLYLQEINYDESYEVATIKIFRGNGAGYQGWELTLTRDKDNLWTVTTEVELEAQTPP